MATVTPYSNLQALVIDDMATQLSTLRGHLNLLGITKTDGASSAEDALKHLRGGKKYSLILCDFNLNAKSDGQQFFEYLRENQLLPPDCLFFMITAESTYASVAAASEHNPDAYLLKPITPNDIEDRLKSGLEKRDVLLPIHLKTQRDDLVGAVAECDKVLAPKNRWTMSVLQLKGHLLLKMGRHEDAKAVYHSALEQRSDLTWAHLGLARAHKAAGQFDQARQIAQDILNSPEGAKNMAAFDLVAEALESQGDMQGAMWVLREASEVVPSARRHRMLGESAYRNGDLDTAKDSLSKATKSSKGSLMAQPQDTLLLAQTLIDRGEGAAALTVLGEGQNSFKNNPGFANVAMAIQVQAEVATGQTEKAKATLQRARETVRKGKADFGTVALAKAEIMSGNTNAGLQLMASAISSDHENLRVKQLITKALHDTGNGEHVGTVVDAATVGLQNKVSDARKLLRNSQIDDAVLAIEAAVREFPENTGVLLQAAQINCMALRLKKEHNAEMVARVRGYLTRLDKLMPGNDRVNMMKRYFRETLHGLEPASGQPA
jgi:tetratricopeptide (TPR) repeat protein